MRSHLEPLAIAANITQAAHCRLDQVLTIFGLLYRSFSRYHDARDQKICDAVLSSISKRWAKADQDIFIAAIILNPILKTHIFAPTSGLNYGAIFMLLGQLWTRFYYSAPPDDLHICL